METKANINNSVIELCAKKGSGFAFIDDFNRAEFYPLLMAIEETAALYSEKNSSLKDSEIIESLKKIRDNIFNQSFGFNQLEKEIIDGIKFALLLNKYDQRDVLLSISSILNSAKLHRSVDGARGYVTFITKMFNELRNIDSKEEEDLEEEDLENDDGELWEKGGFAEKIKPEEMNLKMRTLAMGHDEEINYNCRICDAKISAHNKDWHDGMCDKCFDDKCKDDFYIKDE